MEIRVKNPLGKNNFDKLASAGLVEGKSETPEQKQVKIEARIQSLNSLDAKFAKLQAALDGLYVKSKPDQLSLLTKALGACKKLLASPLPQGTKSRVTSMISELTSLREGVFTGAASDKKALVVIGCLQAREQFSELITAATAQIAKLKVEANDMDDFYREAEDAIADSAHESDNVIIGNKPFIVARVSVVPVSLATVDGATLVAKLNRLGFKASNMAGYPAFRDQIVLGLNPKALNVSSDMKSAKSKQILDAEADRVRRILSKAKGEKLQLVSGQPFSYKGGTYYWLMTEKDLNQFAKAMPSGSVKVTRWGFAFN